MDKQAIIKKFEKLVLDELNELRKIPNLEDRLLTAEVLFKIHKYLKNFDELEPVLNEYFKKDANEKKWEQKENESR
jgi:hypothetical protein